MDKVVFEVKRANEVRGAGAARGVGEVKGLGVGKGAVVDKSYTLLGSRWRRSLNPLEALPFPEGRLDERLARRLAEALTGKSRDDRAAKPTQDIATPGMAVMRRATGAGPHRYMVTHYGALLEGFAPANRRKRSTHIATPRHPGKRDEPRE